MSRTTLNDKGQLTLPAEVRAALRLRPGDDVELEVTAEDTVVMRGLTTIPTSQAWFWQESWQQGEREASAELTRGEGRLYGDGDALVSSLHD